MVMSWYRMTNDLENGSREQSEPTDSIWRGATKYPFVRRMDLDNEEIGIRTGGEQGYANTTNGKFNIGIEKTKQQNALRDEIYAQVLDIKIGTKRADASWNTGLNQILQVIDQLPPTLIEGRVYVCEDGEIGIVWDDGRRRVEISAGVVSYVEYLIWEDEENAGMEREWDVEEEQSFPDELRAALAKYQ